MTVLSPEGTWTAMFFRVEWQDRHTKKLDNATSPQQIEHRRADAYLYQEEATHGPVDGPGRYSHKNEGPEFTRVLQSAEPFCPPLWLALGGQGLPYLLTLLCLGRATMGWTPL